DRFWSRPVAPACSFSFWNPWSTRLKLLIGALWYVPLPYWCDLAGAVALCGGDFGWGLRLVPGGDGFAGTRSRYRSGACLGPVSRYREGPGCNGGAFYHSGYPGTGTAI